jgi:hypothetical protein
MIELGSKTLFFINLIIHAVVKCGETSRQRLLHFLLDYLRAEQEPSYEARLGGRAQTEPPQPIITLLVIQ